MGLCVDLFPSSDGSELNALTCTLAMQIIAGLFPPPLMRCIGAFACDCIQGKDSAGLPPQD